MKQQINDIGQFEELLEQHNRFLFIKHSLTCPISKEAFRQFSEYDASLGEDVKTYYLHVQESRELSAYIAEKLGVKHESPQALLIDHGAAIWNASHWNITADSLKKASAL
ncbi:bacillithiol system redox-active protein YtxJ [Bacillus sp. FJAT-42376]|uniref:bacillithiol system redox-active protein YtxJ n=1 Tax=Bacillus sp. FJAT-42376 TaxID=2014076 RepID=UPI000F510697|nr:bacillithiol system redox-active protein YtxJ [Bacillus sp. FJAT-42376]AZB43972.1 bacillithiol system redox-active protein YtxJ [Bacillus sp. FJAT-42376]